jgi:hypothetical protein
VAKQQVDSALWTAHVRGVSSSPCTGSQACPSTPAGQPVDCASDVPLLWTFWTRIADQACHESDSSQAQRAGLPGRPVGRADAAGSAAMGPESLSVRTATTRAWSRRLAL